MPEYKLNIVFMALTFAQTCFIIQLTNNYYYHLELYVGLGDRQVVVGGGGGGFPETWNDPHARAPRYFNFAISNQVDKRMWGQK